MLIPLGAALIAGDRVLSTVNEAIAFYSTPSRAQSQLHTFEQRGSTACNHLESELRNRLQAELRRTQAGFAARVENASSQIESMVQTRLKEASELADRIQERILSLV